MNQTIITSIGWIFAFLFIVPHIRSWIYTNAFFGGISFVMIRQMFQLCRFTGHISFFGLSILAISSLVVISLIGVSIPSGFIAAIVSISIVPFLRLLMPPAVLFLAGSSDRATSLFFQLNMLVTPLRIVTLLDPLGMGITGRMMRLDLMRTTNENTWKSMVHRIMEIAPIYIIDTVHRTGPVRYEAYIMLAPERAGRTVFICDDEGECPSLLEEGIDPQKYAIPVFRVSEMDSAVLRSIELYRRLPKTDKKQFRKVKPIVAENWESMPSLLMVSLADGIDGEQLIKHIRNIDKDLIAFLLPLSILNKESSKISIDLSIDFSRDPDLVGLYLKKMGLAFMRRDFVLQNEHLFDIHVKGLGSGLLSFEDLVKPDPVGVAIDDLFVKLRKVARQQNLEFRFANK